MCVVSMTGDFFDDRWRKTYPWAQPSNPPIIIQPQSVPKEEFDALRREVELLRDLLVKSKEYDKKNSEPDCEIDEKMNKLREIAKLVGIDLDDVLKKSSK